jgi:hypothetical protein
MYYSNPTHQFNHMRHHHHYPDQDRGGFILPLLAGVALTAPFWAGGFNQPQPYPVPYPFPAPYPQPYPQPTPYPGPYYSQSIYRPTTYNQIYRPPYGY